jgi:DNA-binding transcriptional LysR family regulator
VIDPRRLRVLRALADHGTVTAAGKALHFSPSAVSQQLAALESEVGQELLHRHGRRVRLTSAGQLLVRHADAVLTELDRADASMAAHAIGTLGTVEIAAFASSIIHVVAPALAVLRTEVPNLTVLVRDAEGQDSMSLLLDGSVDLAVAVGYLIEPAPDNRVVRDPLYTDPFDVLLPPGHALAGLPEVDLHALAEDDWIAPLEGNPCRDVVLAAGQRAGFTPRVTHVSDDFHAEAALVAAGAGVALVPRTALGGAHGAVVRPVSGTAPVRRVFAAIRRGREDHPRISAVHDALQEVAAGASTG